MVMGAAIICMRLNARSGTWVKLEAAGVDAGALNADVTARDEEVGITCVGPGTDVLVVVAAVALPGVVPAPPRPPPDDPPATTPVRGLAPGAPVRMYSF
jgi:hypothetical protein